MARTPRTTTRVVYQIKVTLKGSKPPIWRRMQITSDTTLVQFHRILQCVMGWEGSHLYHCHFPKIEMSKVEISHKSL
jgi:Plasmid pRiA4b ORF-3-like protein